MIFGLILILAIVVILAFFIGKNIGNVCSIWFFNTFENVPVATLVFIAFAAGIVFSIICIIIYKIRESDKEDRAEKRKKAELKKAKKQEKINKKKSLLKKAEKIESSASETTESK